MQKTSKDLVSIISERVEEREKAMKEKTYRLNKYTSKDAAQNKYRITIIAQKKPINILFYQPVSSISP